MDKQLEIFHQESFKFEGLNENQKSNQVFQFP
jgi:hypothetical protein